MTPLYALLLLAAPSVENGFPWPAADTESVAAKLMEATVTVRCSPPRGVNQPADPNSTSGSVESKQTSDAITVSSGVSLGNGLIVTFSNAPTTNRYRVTLPDGEQAEAELRVADEYSGLRLLEIHGASLPGLEFSEQLPNVGAPVLTAAAAGIERPIVSMGILGATDRFLGGTGLPPLLQCDLRTTDTSPGAAVVDREGKLIGLIAAITATTDRAQWTYALPARHVQRLLVAQNANRLVVLRRERPIVGLTMTPSEKEGLVRIERVERGGPADRAGIKPGDLLISVDDRKMRSAYQAVDLILKKLPGDKIQMLIEQDGEHKLVDVTLGGTLATERGQTKTVFTGVQVGAAPMSVRIIDAQNFELRRLSASFRAGEAADAASVHISQLPVDDLTVLKVQITAFEKIVDQLQAEVAHREALQAKTEAQLKKLSAEIERLRMQLEEK